MTSKDPVLRNGPLPVEVVFHPSWWHANGGISFDEDFFYHPLRRVEDERRMENILHERFGDLGLGEDHGRSIPVVGAVHNAMGYLLSEMLGCRVEYRENAPPAVIQAAREELTVDLHAAFRSNRFLKLLDVIDALKRRYGYASGDVNWAGVLNLALDVRGTELFLDFTDRPAETKVFLGNIADLIERFTSAIAQETGTTSVSVNRTVRHIEGPVFLHSECALTMVSEAHYREFLMPYDRAWTETHRPFGIHYCGGDPHRFARVWKSLPGLDFLDVGWGGDLRALRAELPETFLNIRLSPVEILRQSPEEIRQAITSRVSDSGNPLLTGVCCINMDDQVKDEQVAAIFKTVFELRKIFTPQ